MLILVTGFAPFGGDVQNASRDAVLRLAERWADDAGAEADAGAAEGRADVELVVGILPVAFSTAPAELRRLVAEHAPAAVVAVGEAGGRTAITPELHGRNRMDARIPDELGDQPRDVAIDDGPELRPATLDVGAMVEAIRALGLPAEPSRDAGAFVCNRVAVEIADLGVPAAFVHVPAVRSEGIATVGRETDADALPAAAALDVDDLAHAIGACVDVAADAVRAG